MGGHFYDHLVRRSLQGEADSQFITFGDDGKQAVEVVVVGF